MYIGPKSRTFLQHYSSVIYLSCSQFNSLHLQKNVASQNTQQYVSLSVFGSIQVRIIFSQQSICAREPDRDLVTQTLSDRFFWSAPECDCRVLICTNHTERENTAGFELTQINQVLADELIRKCTVYLYKTRIEKHCTRDTSRYITVDSNID